MSAAPWRVCAHVHPPTMRRVLLDDDRGGMGRKIEAPPPVRRVTRMRAGLGLLLLWGGRHWRAVLWASVLGTAVGIGAAEGGGPLLHALVALVVGRP